MMFKKRATAEEIESTKTWDTWEKEPSEFPWFYNQKEICYIIEGNASVKDKSGNSITFSAGDWVEFNRGLECVWNITETIRKKYRFED